MNRPPNPDAFPPTDRLLTVCTPGQGELVVSGAGMPEFAAVTAPVSDLPTDRAFLTPHTEDTLHPLGTRLTPGDFYRGADDVRSFSLVMPADARARSLTIKGGDLPWMHEASDKGQPPAAERVLNGQIPGGALVEEAQREFHMAAHIQHAALAALGRLTFTAVPLRVTTIDSVQSKSGELVSLRDYLNSPEYFTPKQNIRTACNMESEMGLGDLLVGRLGMKAAEYLYMTPGLNVRVTELVNARYIRMFDDGYSDRHEDLWSEMLGDPISSYGASGIGFGAPGDNIPPAPDRKNTVFRRVYGLLGETYGFDAEALFVKNQPVTDRNYMRELAVIPEFCEWQGIADQVLTGFIQRITEVAASLHAQDMTFSRKSDVGSSLLARNVNYDGTVLDLETAGEFTQKPKHHIRTDYTEMALTVAVLRRAVSNKTREDLPGKLRAAYLENLAAFGAGRRQRSRIERSLRSDPKLAEIKRNVYGSP